MLNQNSTRKLYLVILFLLEFAWVYAQSKSYHGFSFTVFSCSDCDSILQNIKNNPPKDPTVHKVNLLLEKGRLLSIKKEYIKALNLFNMALELAIEEKNSALEAKAYHYIGYLHSYSFLNAESEAYLYFLKSSAIYKKLQDWDNYYTLNGNIAIHKSRLGKNDEAESLTRASIEYFKKIKNQHFENSLEISLAEIIMKKGDYKESVKILKNLLAKNITNQQDLSYIYQNLSNTYSNLDNLKLALTHINKAIELSESIRDSLKLMELYTLKADVLKKQTHFNKSNDFYSKSLEIAINEHNFSEIIKNYESIINNKILLKDYESVPKYMEILQKWKDSLEIENSNLSQNQVEMEQKYINQKLMIERQVKKLNQEKSQKKLILLVTFSSILLIFLLSFIFYHTRINDKKNLNIIKLKELQLEKQQELEALENANIKRELNLQKREMLNSLIFLRNMNNEVKKVVSNIDKIAAKSVVSKQDMEKLKKDIINRTNKQIQKNDFDNKLSNVHTKFFINILDKHPDLTSNELKVLAYLKVGLTTKEIAEFQNVTIEAVRKSRYRIRKKLNLDENASLEQYTLNFS